MDLPTDRLLLMIIVATGFAVVGGGWAASLVHAEATGMEENLLRIGIGVVFFAILIGFWLEFWKVDKQRENQPED